MILTSYFFLGAKIFIKLVLLTLIIMYEILFITIVGGVIAGVIILLIEYMIKHRRICYSCKNRKLEWDRYTYNTNDLYNVWKCKWVNCKQSFRDMEIKNYCRVFRGEQYHRSMRYNKRQRIWRILLVRYHLWRNTTSKGNPLPMFERIV